MNMVSSNEGGSDKFKTWQKEREISGKGLSLQEATYTIRSLGDMLCDGDLNLCPKYQRGYVWKKERAARLVETVLGNRFIPPIILHEQHDGRYDVIDGKQRLATILSFWFGENDSTKFELPLTAVILQPENEDNGEEHPLKGLTFQNLSEPARKRYINFKVSVKVVSRECDEEMVYEIYEDINSGADDLNAQQLRRAIFHGPYMDLIDTLRENNDFMLIRGSDMLDQYEQDGEMILRAFALTNTPITEFKGPIKKFLNRDAGNMNKLIKNSNDNGLTMLHKIQTEFELITKSMITVFGADKVCREYLPEEGKWSDKLSLWLWDSIYMVLKELYQDDQITLTNLETNQLKVVELFQKSFMNNDFFNLKKISKNEILKRNEIIKEIFVSALNIKDDKKKKKTSKKTDYTNISGI